MRQGGAEQLRGWETGTGASSSPSRCCSSSCCGLTPPVQRAQGQQPSPSGTRPHSASRKPVSGTGTLVRVGPSVRCQLGSRAAVAPRPLLSIAARQLGDILCSAMTADALKPGFRGQGSRPPCSESPYLDIMTPLYPGLLLGAAANPLGRRENTVSVPRASLWPGVGSDSSQAAFRGLALCPGVQSLLSPAQAQPGEDVRPFRWGPPSPPRAIWTLVPLKSLTFLPTSLPAPTQRHSAFSTIPLVKRKADPQK